MPTGAGKTATATKLAQLSHAKGKSVLFVAHRKEIVEQLSQALDRWDVPHGLIVAGKKSSGDMVTVASIQTVVRRKIPEADLIVIDECHHAVEGSFYERAIGANPHAYLLGLTATPCRLDGRGLSGFFDVIVEGPSLQSLIDAGHLVKPIVYSPSLPDLSGIRTIGGDYDKHRLAEIMSGAIVGDAIAEFRRRGVPPAVVFCTTVRHAEETAVRFIEAGFTSEALSGHTPPEQRADILRRLETRRLDVLTSCEVISEGTDLPAVGTAIMLRPTQSFVLYRQQVGRALRTSDGKDRAIILDHAGNALRHGLPTDYIEWTLEGRPRRSGSQAAPSKRCPSCYAVCAASCGECPDCGHVFIQEAGKRSVRKIKGELEEVKHTPRVADDLRNAKSYQDMLAIARKRGYKPGWAWHRWANRKHK